MSTPDQDSTQTRVLLERIKAGDAAAFDERFARHRTALPAFVDARLDDRVRARVDPSDVVQETQIDAFRRLQDYLEREPMPFRLWLRKTAYERLLKVQRFHAAALRSVERESALPNRSSLLLTRKLLDRGCSPIAVCREAIRRKVADFSTYLNMGNAFQAKGALEESIRVYREATRLDPGDLRPHYNTANALYAIDDLEGAVEAMRRAIALNPLHADPHVNLGVFLIDLGDPAGAEESLQTAIRLNADSALAHTNPGVALLDQGRFAEALAERRRGHELGIKQPGWQHPSDKYVLSAQRFVNLDQKLPAVLRREIQPADVNDLLLYADICKIKKLYAQSVSFYKGAFAAVPAVQEERRRPHRYYAACVAALAGCSQGKDDPAPDEQTRAELRKQSLEWLRAELSLLKTQLSGGTSQASRAVQKTILQWRRDPNLACVRDPAALTALPDPERDAFCEFWTDVGRLFTQAREAGMER